MSYAIRQVDYFYTTVEDQPCATYEVLSRLAARHVNLLALNAMPSGPTGTQLRLFPDENQRFLDTARDANLQIGGPHPALLLQGDDAPGTLAEIHEKLAASQVCVYYSSGVVSGHGHFGYVVYARPDDYQGAIAALRS